MSAPDDVPVEPSSPSIAARLRERYGAEVDPAVELNPDDERTRGATEPGPRSAITGGVLARLGSRGQGASRYSVRGEIARGGMGAILDVYDSDLRRRLAMKVVLDRDSGTADSAARTVDPATLARFLEEAQVTGQLDHPGIVPVHELGLDANGQVYFTMRLVRGRDLESVFTLASRGEEGWTTTRVLGVLLKVCEAMAYAHSKGVVHRDLKPANVMVGRFGEVYVMDWGLARVREHVDRHDVRPAGAVQGGPRATFGAKAQEYGAGGNPEVFERIETDRREASRTFTDEALKTVDGDVIGTPSYMAPEQARGDLGEIDERTDVYAAGAMLYRLLTGLAPYTSRTERYTARQIWESVLQGPPRRIEDLAPEAPAELVAICEKAMQREKSARYANMLALAEDLRAFLEGRVVRAFETGAVAEARKWVSRNRPLAAALAGGVVALVAGLVASLVFAQDARDSAELAEKRRGEAAANAQLAETRRGEAEANAKLAEQRRVEAEQNAQLAEQRRLQADDNAKLAEARRVEADANATEARKQAAIATETNSFLNDDVLAAIAPEHQGVDVSMKTVLDRAALTLGMRPLSPEVESALRMTIGTSYEKLGEFDTARKQFERALELRRGVDGGRSELAIQSRISLAGALTMLGRQHDALELYRESIPIATEVLGPRHRGTLALRSDYALALSRDGRRGEARAEFEAVLKDEDAASSPNDPNVISAENNLGNLDLDEGRYADAIERFEHVVQRRMDTGGARDPETLRGRGNLALALMRGGRVRESEAELVELVPVMREVFGDDHPTLGRALGTYGTLLYTQGRTRQAETVFAEALKVLEAKLGPDNPDTLLARHNLATSITDPKRQPEVLELHRAVYEAQKKTLGPEHPATLDSMNSVASTLLSLARLDEAETAYRELVKLSEDVHGSEHPFTLIVRENLANVLYSRRDYAGAAEIDRDVLDIRKRILGDDHPDVAKSTYNLGMVLLGKGEFEGALALFEEARERNQRAYGSSHPNVVMSGEKVGDVQMKLERFADAAKTYQLVLAALKEANREDEETGYVLHQIGAAFSRQGDDAGALEWFDRAFALRERRIGPDAFGTKLTLLYRVRTLHKLGRDVEAEPVGLDFMKRMDRDPKPNADLVKRGRELLVEIYTALGKPDKANDWR